MDEDWAVPINSTYAFVFDKSNYSWINVKDVTFKVIKYWTGSAYKDITQNQQLLTYEFAYIGLVLVLVGIGLTIFCEVRKLKNRAKLNAN